MFCRQHMANFYLACFIVFSPCLAAAAEPTLRSLDIRGLRINGVTTLTVDGDDLGKSPRLLLPFPANQSLKPGATDKKASFDVELDDNVETGYYQLRIVTEGGVSLPIVIGVDRLRQLALTPKVDELPIALHGSVAGSTIVETKFQGKAKQRIMIEVEAQRLGSKLRPVLHLHSPKKLQIAWSWGVPSLFGDTRLEATLPEDGAYTITLHDAEYAAAAPSHFRLKLGDWSFVDQVYPPTLAVGSTANIELLGKESTQIKAAAPKFAGFLALTVPQAGNWSGPRPFVTVSPHAEHQETPNAGKIQEIAYGMSGVSGKLSTPYEEDRYRIAVTPGKKIKLEVFADRLGSPIDVALVIRNDKGDQLARAEDSPGTLDPALEYAVPDKVTSIIVCVVDAQGRGGKKGIYRLVIDPQLPDATSHRVKLTTPISRVTLPVGGRAIVPIFAERRGYAGAIDVTSAQPLVGVKLQGTNIPPDADGTLITLERAAADTNAAIFHWLARSADGAQHAVLTKNHPLERLQPWLATEIAVAPSNDKANEFAIEWGDVPEKTSLLLASRVALPIKIARPMSKSTVKLTLLTSQLTPLVNNQPDPNKSLVADKLAELSAATTSTVVNMLVPVELAASSYDVTIQAELLDAAKKVQATAYAPVRRMPVIVPLVAKLNGSNRVEAAFDAKKGTTLKLEGTIERREGIKIDVQLAITGLPAGAKAEVVTVKADATAFTTNITLPPTIAAGEYGNVKLTASYAPNAKQPNVRVKSRDVEVTLVLKSVP